MITLCALLSHWRSPFVAATPESTIRYVATSGVDSGDCIVNPCATLQYTHDQATAGDTIQIAAGTYVGGVILNRSLTLQGAGAETTIVDGDGAQSAIQLFDTTASLTIRQLTIRNGGAYGLSSGGQTLIEEAIIRDNTPLLGIMAVACACGGQPPFARAASTPTVGCTAAASTSVGR